MIMIDYDGSFLDLFNSECEYRFEFINFCQNSYLRNPLNIGRLVYLIYIIIIGVRVLVFVIIIYHIYL